MKRDLHDVYNAMLACAVRRRLANSMLTLYKGKRAVVEGIAHELAHQLEAGRGFERRIHKASAEEANDHEASALRIEVAALAMLGIRVSLRYLWRYSNWRPSRALGRLERPALTRERRRLSERERRCAVAFVQIVREQCP